MAEVRCRALRACFKGVIISLLSEKDNFFLGISFYCLL